MAIQGRNTEETRKKQRRNKIETGKEQARNRLSIERGMLSDKVKKSLALRLGELRCEPRNTLHEQ